MSYVPDYIRPVSVTSTASVTSSKASQRKTSTNSDIGFSPTQNKSPRRISPPEDRTPRRYSHIPSRWRGPQEKVCGRVSIKDRLKSLESEADVKLSQVTSPTQRPKNRSVGSRRGSTSKSSTTSHESIPSEKQSNIVTPVHTGNSIPASVVHDESPFVGPDSSKDPTVPGDKQCENGDLESICLKAPAPDIIESHKPKTVALSKYDEKTQKTAEQQLDDISREVREDDPTLGAGVLSTGHDVCVNKAEKFEAPPQHESTVKDNNLVKENLAQSYQNHASTARSEDVPREPDLTVNIQKAASLPHLDSPSLDSPKNNIEFAYNETSTQTSKNSVTNEKHRKNVISKDQRVSRSFSLLWKTPSQETISRLGARRFSAGLKDGDKFNLVKKPALPLKPSHITSIEQSIMQKQCVDSSDSSKGKIASQDSQPVPAMLDVKTATATVPVELRSPRGERGNQGIARQGTRDKRNARVFVTASSDSDSENPFARLRQNFRGQVEARDATEFLLTPDEIVKINFARQKSVDGALKHVSPVKFVPSVLKRDYVKSKSLTEENIPTQQSDVMRPEQLGSHLAQNENGQRRNSAGREVWESSHHQREKRTASASRRKTARSPKHGESPSLKSGARHRVRGRNDPQSRRRSSSLRDMNRGKPSPAQEAVARAVKFGNTPDATIPFIDDATSPSNDISDETFALDDSGTSPRRISYMEAMESSSDFTPDPDDGSPHISRGERSRGRTVLNGDGSSGKLLRSNSADSVLSTVTGGRLPQAKDVVRARALSVDRNLAAKRVHRHSYQIATCGLPAEGDKLTTPKRQPSIRKLKNFFGESTPQILDATEDPTVRKGRRTTVTSTVLVLDDERNRISRSGYLYFKVATIEKGKRTSSQKSWKSIWAILKDQQLYLCKDWSRYKNNPEVSPTTVPYQLILEEEEPLSVRSSLVGIAYNYTKRRNVFKLTTFNGSEYLFQAESRDDMLAWISAIQEESICHEDGVDTVNEDLILRKTNQIELGANFSTFYDDFGSICHTALMPFHNYSSTYSEIRKSDSARLIVPKPSKFVPYRHSSPAACEAVNPGDADLLPKLDSEDRKKTKTGNNYQLLDKNSTSHSSGGVSNPNYIHSGPGADSEYFSLTDASARNTSPSSATQAHKSTSTHRLHSSIPQKDGLEAKGAKGTLKNKGLIDSTHADPSGTGAVRRSKSSPVIVTRKPPKPTPSPAGSPNSLVRRRDKRTYSPKSNPRRRGVIWDTGSDQQVPISISSPVLISHQVTDGDSSGESSSVTGPKVKPRDIDQQEALLNRLKLEPQPSEDRQESRYSSASSKMAEKIQRTIKALYNSTTGQRKQSFDLLEETVAEETPVISENMNDGPQKNNSPSLKHNKLAGDLNERSPKADKRANRKRSPKPGRRNNLQVKDVDGSRRFKWRGSVNKIVKKFGTGQPFLLGGTFGVHLEDCPPSPVNEFVPFVVELCCRIVEERGLHFTGIYRVPGNSAALSSLQEDLNMHGVESIESQDDRLKELNVVSSLLKSFFRKLPDPLFTNELYNDFIQANRRTTPEERMNGLRRLVHMLPGPHYETLKFLIKHLRLVADNCHENKMEVRNLAIVFGPTLVRSTASDNMATMVTDMSDQCRIVERIIEHAAWFFLDEDAGVPPKASAVPAEDSHQPVPSIGFLLENVGRKPGDTSGNTSDSSKSKCSNESEKDSFSRDVIELLFGKKWRPTVGRHNNHGQANAADSADEHGGFEDPHRKHANWSTPAVALSQDSPHPKLPERTTKVHNKHPAPQQIAPTRVQNPCGASTSSGTLDVSERLYEFYQEHLERLSKTTIGQPLPTFSSTESSPQITPRNSSDGFSIAYPALKRTADSYLRSEPPDPHSVRGASHDIPALPPYFPKHAAERMFLPSNMSTPWKSEAPSGQPVVSSAVQGQSSSASRTDKLHSNFPTDVVQGGVKRDNAADNVLHDALLRTKHKQDPSKTSTYTDDSAGSIPLGDTLEEKLRNLTNLDETLQHRQHQHHLSGRTTDYETEPSDFHEMLVGESVPVQHSQRTTRGIHQKANTTEMMSTKPPTQAKFNCTSPERCMVASQQSPNDELSPARKSAQELYEKKKLQRQQQQRRKTRLKGERQNACPPDENSFKRFDPKRRVIRSSSGELDPLQSAAHRFQIPLQRSTKTCTNLSAKERLFDMHDRPQPVFRKKSFVSQQRAKQRVARRHTLSGIVDFTSHGYGDRSKAGGASPHVRSGSNLDHAYKNSAMPDSSLSMHDLTLVSNQIQSSGCIPSAMDRLRPKGATSDLTLENWMVKERLKNDTARRDLNSRSISGGLDPQWHSKGHGNYTYKSYV